MGPPRATGFKQFQCCHLIILEILAAEAKVNKTVLTVENVYTSSEAG